MAVKSNTPCSESGIDWNFHLLSYGDPDAAYSNFINHFVKIFDNCFPLQKTSLKRKTSPRKPWITKGLIRSCCHKDKLYKQFKLLPNITNKTKFTSYRNKLNKLLRKAQNDYYAEKFRNFKSDVKQTWRLIRCILNNSNQIELYDRIKIGDKTVCDKHKIANEFNKYFINIGADLAKSCSDTGDSSEFKSFLNGDFKNSFSLYLTTPEEISDIVAGMPPKSSSGYDEIPMHIMKFVIPFIADPLSFIINSSFSNGIVPDHLKIAKVYPLFKSGDRCLLNNYRPISVLPSFSKIMEKLVYNRLMAYLTRHNILYDYQFGFRSHHDTTLAVIEMIDRITAAIDSKCYSLGIFIDLSKAFDSINHQILLEKLHHYGIRGIAHKWFLSYLTNRQQYVDINGYKSTRMKISCGVPQGSILGPLLFLIFVNDMANVSKLLHLILFADDTNIFYLTAILLI